MSDEPVVALENVSFAYDGPPVLENVTLAVRELEWACIVGPNGGGKTTLLKLILGLLRPTEGRVRVFGEAPERARPRVGYVPQHVHYDPQFPVSVMDIVLMGRLGLRVGRPFSVTDREEALSALDELGIAELSGSRFSAISGGQQQGVLIARALCCRPDLLLLDEPTAHIDAMVEATLVEILRKLNQRMTILTVSHDLGFVSSIVKQVICVNRRVFVHPTEEITGAVIEDLYGGDIRMILHHDHGESEKD